MKLARKVMIALVLGISAVLVAYAWARVRRESGAFEEEVRRDHRVFGRALGAAVARVWASHGEATALDVVEDTNARYSHVLVRWVWLDATEDEPRHPRVESTRLWRVLGGERVAVVVTAGSGARALCSYLPVRVPSPRDGALELCESLSAEQRFLRATVVRVGATIGTVAVVCGLIVVGLGYVLLGRPMRALVEKTRRIGAGDLEGPLDLRQEDEIGELAREMNSMCDRLREARDRVLAETSARIVALEQLRHADRLTTVGKLASGLAHELGTPLSVVAGRARSIETGRATAEEALEAARIVREQAERMTLIIRHLLDFARRRPAQKCLHDLRLVARQTAELLEPMAQKHGVALRLDGGADPALARIDPAQIQQALTNLVVNGIQAMPDGGALEISVGRSRASPPPDHGGAEGGYLSISVADRGPGIAADVLPHVFEPFFTTKGVGEQSPGGDVPTESQAARIGARGGTNVNGLERKLVAMAVAAIGLAAGCGGSDAPAARGETSGAAASGGEAGCGAGCCGGSGCCGAGRSSQGGSGETHPPEGEPPATP